MKHEFAPDLKQTMAEYGFHQVIETATIPDAILLLKRQTWNTNRAIVVVSPAHIPSDIRDYLQQVRKHVAFRCGFFPMFWGIGIQVVVVASGVAAAAIDPAQHVSRVDNQWAIIQSIFFADPLDLSFRTARTWGQVFTGKFQDAISVTLSRYYQLNTDDRSA